MNKKSISVYKTNMHIISYKKKNDSGKNLGK